MRNKTTKIISILIILFAIISVAGCEKIDKEAELELLNWAEEVGLDKDESSKTLYRRALEEEGGKVVIYSISSRMTRIKESFERDYPGMTLEVYDINANDLSTKLKTEYNAGIRTADVVHSKEQTGDYVNNFFNQGILHNYQPKSIFKNVNPQYLEELTPLYIESDWWFYNDKVYSQAPIDNWWDLTKPEWKGKFVLQDPTSTVSYMALFTAMSQNNKQMEKAYEEAFGEPIKLDEDEPSATHAWIKRILANDPIIFESNNEVIQAVGEGEKSYLLGYTPSSKYREKVDKNWNIEAVNHGMKPSSGAVFMNFLAVVDQAPHPQGAKLLIRYLLGDEDGNGDGIQPFNTIGGWPVRPETIPAEGNIPLDELEVWMLDYDYIYTHIQDIQDYWYEKR